MSEDQQSLVHVRQAASALLLLSTDAIRSVTSRLPQVGEIPFNGLPPSAGESLSAQHYGEMNLAVKRKGLEFGPNFVNQYGVSDVEQESFEFIWQLKNYSALAENAEIPSPIFTGGLQSKHKWQLSICPKNIHQGEEYLGVCLGLIDFGDGDNLPERKVKGRFQIKLLDADWKPGLIGEQVKWIEFKTTTQWGYKKVLSTATLRCPTRRLLENDTLRILCRIWMLGNSKEKIFSGGVAVRSLAEEAKVVIKNDTLALDMGMALRNSLLTDIEIQAVDEVFQAHRAVLAARSTVFANLLNASSLDSEITKIWIQDFDGEVVQALLDYMYIAEVNKDVLKRRATDLLQAAEKYDLDGLKEDCEYALGEGLTVENAADMLTMGDLYRANSLKQVAMEFINRHKEQIYKTPSFQLLVKTKSDLLAELYVSEIVNAEDPLTLSPHPTSDPEPVLMNASTT